MNQTELADVFLDGGTWGTYSFLPFGDPSMSSILFLLQLWTTAKKKADSVFFLVLLEADITNDPIRSTDELGEFYTITEKKTNTENSYLRV